MCRTLVQSMNRPPALSIAIGVIQMGKTLWSERRMPGITMKFVCPVSEIQYIILDFN